MNEAVPKENTPEILPWISDIWIFLLIVTWRSTTVQFCTVHVRCVKLREPSSYKWGYRVTTWGTPSFSRLIIYFSHIIILYYLADHLYYCQHSQICVSTFRSPFFRANQIRPRKTNEQCEVIRDRFRSGSDRDVFQVLHPNDQSSKEEVLAPFIDSLLRYNYRFV